MTMPISVFPFAHPPPFGAYRPVFVVASRVVFLLASLSVPYSFRFTAAANRSLCSLNGLQQKTNGTQFEA